MKAFFRKRSRQRGAALILMMTVIVMGLAWYTVGALGKAPRSTAEREIKTGEALAAGKRALLNYVAYRAGRSDEAIPGRLPCPEPLSPASGSEGISWGCSDNTATFIGRLPWRTLGVEQIRDGDGESLWYILGRGLRQSPVHFGTQGMIELDAVDNAAVALIIAPGAPLDTMTDPGSPPAACPRVDQNPRIVTAGTFDPARFLECGRSSVPAPGNEPQYNTTNTSPWTNDRVIAITAAEVMDAIAGPVADRLQRQVAPKLAGWDAEELAATGKSWGSAANGHNRPYLPFASTFGNPTVNDYCGNAAAVPAREGLPPTAGRVASGTRVCPSDWSGSVSGVLGLVNFGCTQETGGGAPSQGWLECAFLHLFAAAPFSVRVTATATNVANSFRGTVLESDVQVTNGGTKAFALSSFSATTGSAVVTVDATWTGLGIFQTVYVRIPNLPDAAVLSDSDVTWFTSNSWDQYTYYAVGSGTTLNAATACVNPGDPGCLTLTGLPASTGNTNDKKLVLTLAGRKLASQTHPSGSPAQYLESHTAGTTVYGAAAITSIFNDRHAACPFRQTRQSGATVTICN